MINQIQLGRINPPSSSMLNGDMSGMSETGEFDFLNYLLGLQAESAIGDIEFDGADLGQLSGSKNLTESDQVLLEVFDKKDQGKNPLLGMQGLSLGSLMANQQLQTEAPLPLEGKGQADWAGIQNLKSDQNTKSKSDKGFLNLEDPLAKVAFEAALKTQPQKLEIAEEGETKLQPGMLQQRGKQVQAFNYLNKEVPKKVEVGVELDPVVSDKQAADSVPLEGIDKPRKKSTDNLEFATSDSAVDTSFNLDKVPMKEALPNRANPVAVPEVFHKVESMVHQGGGKMTLMLTPPELGQVEIHVSTKGKNVEVSVKSDNDFAKMAIESQVADLQQSLQNQDLNLAKLEVHVKQEMDPSFLENQYSGFSRQGNFSQQSEGNRQESSLGTPWKTEATDRSRVSNIHRASARGVDSRVDIRI